MHPCITNEPKNACVHTFGLFNQDLRAPVGTLESRKESHHLLPKGRDTTFPEKKTEKTASQSSIMGC